MGATWRFRTKMIQGPPGPPGTLKNTGNWTPGLILNGASASLTVTVTGAATGMTALGAFSLALPAGVIISAAVTATNTVVLTIANFSGSSQTLAAGVATAEVFTV